MDTKKKRISPGAIVAGLGIATVAATLGYIEYKKATRFETAEGIVAEHDLKWLEDEYSRRSPNMCGVISNTVDEVSRMLNLSKKHKGILLNLSLVDVDLDHESPPSFNRAVFMDQSRDSIEKTMGLNKDWREKGISKEAENRIRKRIRRVEEGTKEKGKSSLERLPTTGIEGQKQQLERQSQQAAVEKARARQYELERMKTTPQKQKLRQHR